MEQESLLKVSNLSRSFGPTRALREVSLEVRRGEIRGLIGENGSGKSTLSSIVAGFLPYDDGSLTLDGRPYRPTTMIGAQRLGVAMIVQERGTIAGLTVAENIFIGKEGRFTRLGVVNRQALNAAADQLLKRIGAGHLRGRDDIDRLDFEDRKIVEIARAVGDDPQLLIVDEATTALAHRGRGILLALLKQMKAEGRSVLFISHDIEELIGVCDVLTVLRDGVLIGNLDKPAMDPKTIKAMMVGRDIGERYYREDSVATRDQAVVLRARGVALGETLKGVDLDLHCGEILGIGGLAGSGMHELGRALFGIDKPASGSVTFADGSRVVSPRASIARKMAFISKDRDSEALLLHASIQDNLVLLSLRALQTFGLVRPAAEKRLGRSVVDQLSIKCASLGQDVRELSGGNKQKVSFGRWIAAGSELFIMDCPTRGVDVGVKAAMYQLMNNLKAEGKAIVLITEELPELIGMSDRVLVLKDGLLAGTFERGPGMNEQTLIEVMV